MYRRRKASTGPVGLEKLAPSKRRTRAKMHAGRQASRQASRQTRVRFIPDDVHVVVIIIIAFCIITIISAATSVIYSRSRVCIMRAGALRLQALITTLPCLFIGIPAKTTPTIIIAAAVEAAETFVRTARNALGNCTGSIAASHVIGMLISHRSIDARSACDCALILIVKSGHRQGNIMSCVNLADIYRLIARLLTVMDYMNLLKVHFYLWNSFLIQEESFRYFPEIPYVP